MRVSTTAPGSPGPEHADCALRSIAERHGRTLHDGAAVDLPSNNWPGVEYAFLPSTLRDGEATRTRVVAIVLVARFSQIEG